MASKEIIMKNDKQIKRQRCCICGIEINYYGNNPAPIKTKGVCCDRCNQIFVIPARIKMLKDKV